MLLEFKNLTIRNATVDDAPLLAKWWNDGSIMAHAGFPNGLGETVEDICELIKSDTDENRRLIIELDNTPIGEMNYSTAEPHVAEIGIKICDFTQQDKGLGKILLSMLIKELFDNKCYNKIILDTNLKNLRAQHVYEKLGFTKVRVNMDSWKDQLGVLQSSVDYELLPENFVDFAK